MLYYFIFFLGVCCQCLVLNFVNFTGNYFVSRLQQLHAVFLQWFLVSTLNINRVGWCSMSCAVAHILHHPQLPYALYPCFSSCDEVCDCLLYLCVTKLDLIKFCILLLPKNLVVAMTHEGRGHMMRFCDF
jgi:hypothetical protein